MNMQNDWIKVRLIANDANYMQMFTYLEVYIHTYVPEDTVRDIT